MAVYYLDTSANVAVDLHQLRCDMAGYQCHIALSEPIEHFPIDLKHSQLS